MMSFSSPAAPLSPPSPRSTVSLSSSLLADVSVDSDSEVSSGGSDSEREHSSSALSTPTATNAGDHSARSMHRLMHEEQGRGSSATMEQTDSFRRIPHARSTAAAAEAAAIAERNRPLPPPAWKQMRVMDPEAILARAAAASGASQQRKQLPVDPAASEGGDGARSAGAPPSGHAADPGPASSVVSPVPATTAPSAASPVPAASPGPSVQPSDWAALLHPSAPSVPVSSGAAPSVTLSRGLYFPARDSFHLEEAELDAQIAAAQLELMQGNDRLSRAAAAAAQQRAGGLGLPRHHLLPAQGGYAAAVTRRALHSGRSGHSPIRARHPDPAAAARSQSQSKPTSRGASPAPPAASYSTPRSASASRGVSSAPHAAAAAAFYSTLHATSTPRPRSSAAVVPGAHKRSSSVEAPVRSRSGAAAAAASAASASSRAASPSPVSFSTPTAAAAPSGSQSARSSLHTPTASSALRQQPAQRLTSTQPALSVSRSSSVSATLRTPRVDAANAASACAASSSTPSIAVPVRGRGRGRRVQRPTLADVQQQQGGPQAQQRSAFGSSVPRSITPVASSSRLGAAEATGTATARWASPSVFHAAPRASTPQAAAAPSSTATAAAAAVSPPRPRARPSSAGPSPTDMRGLASSFAAAAPASAVSSSRSLPLSPSTTSARINGNDSALTLANGNGNGSGHSVLAKKPRPISVKKTAELMAREIRQSLMTSKDTSALAVQDNGSGSEKPVAGGVDVAASASAATPEIDPTREARRLKFASKIKTTPMEGEASVTAPSGSPRARERDLRPMHEASSGGSEMVPAAVASSAAAVAVVPAAAASPPPPAFVSSTTEMLSGLFKFYAHQIDSPSLPPSSASASASGSPPVASGSGSAPPPLPLAAGFVMNRTEMFQFLIECDLIEKLPALAASMPLTSTATSTPTKLRSDATPTNGRHDAIPGLSAPGFALGLDSKKGCFHAVWNTYAESSASSPLSSSALVSPTPQRSLLFAGFTALVTDLAWLLWPGAHPQSPSLGAAVAVTGTPVVDRSPTHIASALIHLLEQWVLPNSSMYNPRSAESTAAGDASDAGRFRVSPSLALFCLFQLEQILAVHAAFLAHHGDHDHPAAGPALAPADAVRPSIERNYALLHSLAKRFQELQQGEAERDDEQEEAHEMPPLLFPAADDPATVSGSSFSLSSFVRLSHYKRRFDSASGRLRFSPHLSPALFVEALLAAVEGQVAASFPVSLSLAHASLGRDRHKKEKQAACVAQMHAFFDTMGGAL